MTGIALKLFSKDGIPHIFRQAELAVAHMDTAHILQIYRRLRRIHLIMAHGNTEIQINDGKLKRTEFSL